MTTEEDQTLDGEDEPTPAPGEGDLMVPARRGGHSEEEEDDGEQLATPSGRPAFITELKSIEVQVGENIVQALRHQDTAAVLTFVQPSPDGGQRLVSIPVDLETLAQFQGLLQEPKAVDEVPCIGFHCVLDRYRNAEKKKDDENKSPAD